MNILFIADPGSVHDLHWMEAMSTRHRCMLLVRRHHQGRIVPEVLEQRNLTVLGILDDFSLLRFWRTRKMANYIAQCVREQKIDVLHVLYAEPNALWMNFAGRFGCKTVITTRGTDVLKTIPAFAQKRTPLAKAVAWFYKRAFRACDAITSTSLKQHEAILELDKKLPKSKLVCIRTGIDLEAIDRATPHAGDNPYVLFPRLMQPIYNHECALDAIALLDASIRHSHRFVFLDANTSNVAYKALIAAKMESVDADILWLPRMAELALFGWMKGAAAVVMTPHSDGTSVSALEALAAGAPVLLPNIGYDSDLFADTSIDFKSNDPVDLSRKLSAVLSGEHDHGKQQRIERIRARASREKEMDRLDALYQRLCAQ